MKNEFQALVWLLLSSPVLSGGPSKTVGSEEQGSGRRFRRDTQMTTLKLISYPADSSTSELCLKSINAGSATEFSQLSPCLTTDPSFHYTIGNFNQNTRLENFYIKSSLNGKCNCCLKY